MVPFAPQGPAVIADDSARESSEQPRTVAQILVESNSSALSIFVFAKQVT